MEKLKIVGQESEFRRQEDFRRWSIDTGFSMLDIGQNSEIFLGFYGCVGTYFAI